MQDMDKEVNRIIILFPNLAGDLPVIYAFWTNKSAILNMNIVST